MFAPREQGPNAANTQAARQPWGEQSQVRGYIGMRRRKVWAGSGAHPGQAAPLTQTLVPGMGWASAHFTPEPPPMQHLRLRWPVPNRECAQQ